jgi:anaerobic magnesium-protoporphyrin IX monomethyl ester cyclase
MIADDNVSINKKRFYGILDGFEKLGVKWRSLIRAETVNDEGLEKMLCSGCLEIGPGIESGSQEILDLVEKKSKVERNIEFVNRCQEIGITCVPSFIIGLPNESPKTIQETYEFMKATKPGAFAYNMFLPLPDCPISLQYESKYKKYITIYPLTWDDCMTKAKKITQCFVSTPHLSREDILSNYYKYYDIFADITGFDPRKRGTRDE